MRERADLSMQFVGLDWSAKYSTNDDNDLLDQLDDWADVLRDGPLALRAVCDEGMTTLELMHEVLLPKMSSLHRAHEQSVLGAASGSIDFAAYDYLKDLLEFAAAEYHTLLLPLAVRGNGNCLINALSWAIWVLKVMLFV